MFAAEYNCTLNPYTDNGREQDCITYMYCGYQQHTVCEQLNVMSSDAIFFNTFSG